MTSFLEGIAQFFSGHRAHCPEHEAYQSDCEACVAANRTIYVDPGTDVMTESGGGPFFGQGVGGDNSSDCLSSITDVPSTYDSCSPSDSPAATDSCPVDTSTSGFSAFGGGDSGGGGASGDF